jgi:hypothetical protein
MRRLAAAVAMVALGMLLAGAASARAADLPSDDTVITGLTADQIGNLFKAMGIEFKASKDDEGDDLFILTLSDIQAQLYTYDKDEKTKAYRSIQFHAVFDAGDKKYLDTVNAWNTGRRFSRAYVGSTGNPHLEADLDLAGGVTLPTVKRFVEQYRRSLIGFLSKLTD